MDLFGVSMTPQYFHLCQNRIFHVDDAKTQLRLNTLSVIYNIITMVMIIRTVLKLTSNNQT